jgi:hypothetical protein
MPGIGLVIDGAMQHAPQPSRQAWGDEASERDMAARSDADNHVFSHAALRAPAGQARMACRPGTRGLPGRSRSAARAIPARVREMRRFRVLRMRRYHAMNAPLAPLDSADPSKAPR